MAESRRSRGEEEMRKKVLILQNVFVTVDFVNTIHKLDAECFLSRSKTFCEHL